MEWRGLRNLPEKVESKKKDLDGLCKLKYNFKLNWIGKLPKPGMGKGWICEVEQRQGFYCGVLRLVK